MIDELLMFYCDEERIKLKMTGQPLGFVDYLSEFNIK